ncbi:MAG: diguanylate cyclase, partial [Pseudomonadota bacterium]
MSSARRGDELHNRIASSRALISVIDVRDAEAEGQAAIEEVHAIDPRGGLAILALGDAARQDNIAAKCYAAGATHFLDMGNHHADLAQALNFADRYAENMRGGSEATDQLHQLLARSDEEWSFSKTSLSDVVYSDQMRRGVGEKDQVRYPVTGFYRDMTVEERLRVRGAMGRLRSGSAQAAIPHNWNGEKVIHHLHDSGSRLHGRIERLSANSAAESWMERDLLSGLRNGAAARAWIRDGLEQGKEIGFVAMGLKNFGTINAAYGRSVGDEVMRRIGQRLIAETSDHSGDDLVVARMDGQNFVVALILDDRATDFSAFADGLLNRLFDPVSIDGREIRLVARAGVATG